MSCLHSNLSQTRYAGKSCGLLEKCYYDNQDISQQILLKIFLNQDSNRSLSNQDTFITSDQDTWTMKINTVDSL